MNYYLCGPVDFDKDSKSWKQTLKDLCKRDLKGVLLFDPDTYTFSSIISPISEYIHNVNMCAIDHADAIIARWMSGQVSVGTPIELYYAITNNKKIILITDMLASSVYINYIASKCVVVTHNIDEAYSKIVELEHACH